MIFFSDGFWHRVTHLGFDPQTDYNVTTMAKCRGIYAGAKLDEELFQYMCLPDSRERLRAVLVQTYFHPKIQTRVIEKGDVHQASFGYAQTLVGQAAEHLNLFGQTTPAKQKQIRDAGFRKAIVNVYDHRCALCGIRMLTPEGHTVVEAAHVAPWHESHDDNPTNGLCLCRLCHWNFDEGLMSVGKEYEVLVSSRVRTNRNIPGHVLTLQDRPIFKPDEDRHWPMQKNLNHHRKNCFAK